MSVALVSGVVDGEAIAPGGVVSLRVTGLKAVWDRVRVLGEDAIEAFAEGIHMEAQDVGAAAQDRAPRKSGNMANSLNVPIPTILGATSIEQIVGFGEASADYALAVHEIPPPPAKSIGGRSARHDPPHGKGGTWKFLEAPFTEKQVDMAKRIADHVANRLGL